MPWRCNGHVLEVKKDGKWVRNSSQSKEKTLAACQRMKAALYANAGKGKHA